MARARANRHRQTTSPRSRFRSITRCAGAGRFHVPRRQLASAGGAQRPGGDAELDQGGIVQDPAALQALVLKGIDGLIETTPTAASSHWDWSEFAKRYGEILARTHGLPGTEASEHLPVIRERSRLAGAIRRASASLGRSQALRRPDPAAGDQRPGDGAPRAALLAPSAIRRGNKVALLVFDGLAFDQWVQIRERLIATTKRFAFDEGNRVRMAADRDIGVAPGAVLWA